MAGTRREEDVRVDSDSSQTDTHIVGDGRTSQLVLNLPEIESDPGLRLGRRYEGANIGFVSFRIAGEDGVSLEINEAWDPYFRWNGAKTHYFAGELPRRVKNSGKGMEFDPAHFLDAPAHFRDQQDPDAQPDTEKRSVQMIQYDIFGEHDLTEDELRFLTSQEQEPKPGVRDDVKILKRIEDATYDKLTEWGKHRNLDMLVTENTQSLPHNLPLALALIRYAKDNGTHVINHMHDFSFENRPWLEAPPDSNKQKLYDYLITGFQSQTPVCINSGQREALAERGYFPKDEVIVMPNLRYFDKYPRVVGQEKDAVTQLQEEIRGGHHHSVILGAMVRPVKRKYLRMGVRLAVHANKILKEEVARALKEEDAGDETNRERNERLWGLVNGRCEPDDVRVKYYVPHLMMRSDEDLAYPRRIRQYAKFHSQRNGVDMEVVYTEEKVPAYAIPLRLHYAAVEQNLYTSKGEGWGNGYLESLQFGTDIVRNIYPVMEADIMGKGEEAISLRARENDGEVERDRETQEIKAAARKMVDWMLMPDEEKNRRRRNNWEVGRKNFSLDQLDRLPQVKKQTN